MLKKSYFFVFLLFLVINLVFHPTNKREDQINNEILSDKLFNLSKAEIRTPIYIDGNIALDAFCMGNGTDGLSWSTAHIIEGYIIDKGGTETCIEVLNTDRFLIIKNCITKNSRSGLWSTGIKLYNCTNVNINHCKVENNDYGIFLHKSHNIILSDNKAIYNNNGIHLFYSNNNSLLRNDASHNLEHDGIYLGYSNYNNLTGNFASYNFLWGISVSGSNNFLSNNFILNNAYGINIWNSNNTVINNLVSYNNISGIIIYGTNNNISYNTISYNRFSGISLSYYANNNILSYNVLVEDWIDIYKSFNNLIDSTNLVNGKSIIYHENQIGLEINGISNIGQLILVNCNNSLISNSDISITATAILLSDCYNNTIVNNSCSYNSHYGILLRCSNNNSLSNNEASNNQNGINIDISNNNILIKNQISFNDECGIILQGSYNVLSENQALYNNFTGILLQNSYYNNLSNNIAMNNEYGILLWSADFSELFANNASFNNANGIQLEGSDYNIIFSNNASYNNVYGIRLEDIPGMMCICDSNDNEIYQNFLYYNLGGCISDLGVETIIYDNLCVGSNIYGYFPEFLICFGILGILILYIKFQKKRGK
ncbi:hypothetical protein ES706_04467 [subsurface metagenome]